MTVSFEEVVRELRTRGVGAQIVAEVDAEAETKRVALRARLAAVRQREATELPKLRTANEAARAAAEAARARYENAKEGATAAEGALMAAAHSIESQAGGLQRQLAELAPPEVGELIAECRQLAVRLRNAGAAELTGPRKDAANGYYYTRMVATNGKAVQQALDQVARIIAEAEALTLTDLDNAGILARVTALRADLPNSHRLEAEVIPSAMNDVAMMGEAFRATETGLPRAAPARPRRWAAFR